MALDNTDVSSDSSPPSPSSSSNYHNNQQHYDPWRPPRPPAIAQTTKNLPTLDISNYPSGKKSLAGISVRAFILGVVLGLCASLATFILLTTEAPHPLWRIPFFLASLALFHFLEYYTTAAYNTRYASISAFLLSSNGWAYNVAHCSAILECLLAYLLYPRNGYFAFTSSIHGIKIQVVLGLILMIVGQTVRSLAMVQAGSNFNHTVQVERREGHTLVTHGLYAVLRHPSYFGFFWWGLGTQLVLGNVVCFVGYMVVLWRFFSSRIEREERFLVAFFGDEYVEYRKRSWVGIPGIH